MANSITTEMLPLGRYLSTSNQIKIPEYQRSYAWTDDEVLQLWDDLIDSMENTRSEYFIGPIVVKREAQKPIELIDGQQRLSTTLVIISILRKILRENGDNVRADILSADYFGKRDIATLEMAEKFLMNEENGDVFRKFVIHEVDRTAIRAEQLKYLKKNSNYLLLQAMLILWDKIESWQNGTFNVEYLLTVFNYLNDKVKILVLSVEDEADAYTIFETLNDRGRSLDTLDLLKNHLFSFAKTHLGEVRSNWGSVRENLLEIDPKNRFLYHFWLSNYGRASRTALFRAMRELVQNSNDAVEFSKKIVNASRIYAALNTPSSSIWDDHETATRKNIYILQILDAQQAFPMLLAAEDLFDKKEFSKLTNILVVMAVRYTFIGEERTGVASNYYSEIPKKIRSGEYKKASHIFAHIKPIYPSDESFTESFCKKTITDSKRARYILAEIENTFSGAEKIVNSDPEYVNLEHILPKNPNQHWNNEVTGLAHDEYGSFIHKIGNLALVSKSKNKIAGSKSFDEKKQLLFQSSEFLTTKSIGNNQTWGKDAINSRQKELAGIAVKTWKIESL